MGDVIPGANRNSYLHTDEVVDVVRFLIRPGTTSNPARGVRPHHRQPDDHLSIRGHRAGPPPGVAAVAARVAMAA